MPTRREFLKISTAVTMAAPSLARAQNAPSPDVSGPNSLRAYADQHGLLVGCAVVPARLENEPSYAACVAAQANLLVAENAMKWQALRPAPGKFDFADADRILAFAQDHNQRVRGHNLCWHEALPSWFAGTVTKDNARQLLVQHIQTVAGHFAGKIHSWDVVNEAIDTASARPDALRDSPWLQLAGDDYIDLAFRTARQADPAALLTYNDYGIELDTPRQIAKRDQVLALVKRLRSNGTPIDAVGVQSHLNIADAPSIPASGLRDFVRELRSINVQVFVTELDVNERPPQPQPSGTASAPNPAAAATPNSAPSSIADRDATVARIYRDYLTMMLLEPNVTAALTWGITDRYTWLNSPRYARTDGQPQRPLPFDADYAPAPAFFAERTALATHATGALNSAQQPGSHP
jgi:endo-1,4-beta-xylanase